MTFCENFLAYYTKFQKENENKKEFLVRFTTGAPKPTMGRVIDCGDDYAVISSPDGTPSRINLNGVISWEDVSDSSGHQQKFK